MTTQNKKQVLVNCKVDEGVKNCSEATLSNMGLNLSSYINLCLRQVCVDKKLPFVPAVDLEFWEVEEEISRLFSEISIDLLKELKNTINSWDDYCHLNYLGDYLDAFGDLSLTCRDTIYKSFAAFILRVDSDTYKNRKLFIKDICSQINDKDLQEKIYSNLVKAIENYPKEVRKNKALCKMLNFSSKTTDLEILNKLDEIIEMLYDCCSKYLYRVLFRAQDSSFKELIIWHFEEQKITHNSSSTKHDDNKGGE